MPLCLRPFTLLIVVSRPRYSIDEGYHKVFCATKSRSRWSRGEDSFAFLTARRDSHEPQGPGFCFRLYTEDSFKAMPMSAEPEIRRCTLTSSILQLKCQQQDLEELEFMDKPDPDASMYLASILDLLYR